jgi:myo-inositol-1(or 4)-monophosphatase
MSSSKYARELAVARQTALAAAELAKRHYGKVERKTKTHAAASSEAVTEADRAVQRQIVTALRAAFPGDGFIGEEDDAGLGITVELPDPAGRVWVIDPIDGTNNFIAGFDHFAICIGLLEQGYPVVGVVLEVSNGRLYSGAKGAGVFVSDNPARCLETPLGDASVLMLSSNLTRPEGGVAPFVTRWIGQTYWKVRVIGSAALEASLVAAGIAHGAVTINGKLWDVAAPAALVLEAGGRVVSPGGQDLFPFDLRNYRGAKVPFLASAPNAVEALVRELNT